MIAALTRFVEALRAERHCVSPAEILDAARAMDLVDLTRRADVKAALRATLAKDRRAAEAFDLLFDRFFAPPRGRAKGDVAGRVAAVGERERPGEAERGAPFRAKPSDRSDRKKSRSFLSQKDAPKLKPVAPRRAGTLGRLTSRPFRVDTGDPVHRDLARRMTTEQEREIAREIPRLVQALKLRVGRRGVDARRGRPWLRRALRDNLQHGGVPFVIPHRAPKRKGTRVVLLVDVSYSVARASGLFLLMAAAFLDLGRRARVVAFVDRPVDATAAVRRWLKSAPRHQHEADDEGRRPRRGKRPGDGIARHSVSFADLLDGLRDLNLEAPSDYGTAFHAFLGSRIVPRGRDTVLVVLGDGRTNRFDPLAFALDELARGLKAVLWLVPEPKSRWGTADSALAAYAGSVDLLVEASDLAGLARGLGELMRRL